MYIQDRLTPTALRDEFITHCFMATLASVLVKPASTTKKGMQGA
jgi:hypothetical protein